MLIGGTIHPVIQVNIPLTPSWFIFHVTYKGLKQYGLCFQDDMNGCLSLAPRSKKKRGLNSFMLNMEKIQTSVKYFSI